MKNKLCSIIFIFLTLLCLTGCNDKKKSPVDENKKPDNQVNEPVPEKKEIQIINMNSDSRPYAVVINNFPSAVKVQTGLSDAYLVYEIPVEGGLVRSLAFFKDKTTAKVGTVRSARHNFLDYIMENDAIFVHFGWSTYAKEQIPKLGINNINGLNEPPFWRENPEKLATEHTAYTSLEKIKSYIQTKGYRKTTDNKGVLNYSTSEIDLSKKDGIVANTVNVPYSGSYSVRYVYNSENKNYSRYVNGNAHIDYFTKEHYTAKNIIITKIDYSKMPDNYCLDLHNIGTGEGYYITDGYAVPITWEKKTRESKTIYKYKDGTQINVNDGNTFIMLHPINKDITIE